MHIFNDDVLFMLNDIICVIYLFFFCQNFTYNEETYVTLDNFKD